MERPALPEEEEEERALVMKVNQKDQNKMMIREKSVPSHNGSIRKHIEGTEDQKKAKHKLKHDFPHSLKIKQRPHQRTNRPHHRPHHRPNTRPHKGRQRRS